MKKENVNIRKIKDWFIIQRIRTLNFIKEHKFLSVGVAVFLMSCIAFLIVFASEDQYENVVKTEELVIKTPNVTEVVDVVEDHAKSFSLIPYTISYTLSNNINEEIVTDVLRKATITAVINSDVDATWEVRNDMLESEISEDGKVLTLNTPDVTLGTQDSQDIYLKLGNIQNETVVETSISVKESTVIDEEETESDKLLGMTKEVNITVESTLLELQTKIVGGKPYKSPEGAFYGRYVPYGILVGFDKEVSDLQGYYFDSNYSLELNVYQSTGDNDATVDSVNIYDRNKDDIYISKDLMPHYVYDQVMPSVYNSGTVELDESNTKMNISNLTTNGTFYSSDDINVLGSYYVLVKSERPEGNVDPIEVFLNDYKLVNEYESLGTRNLDFTVNKINSDGSLIELQNGEEVSYGEELILRSLFTYSKDGDSDIDKLSIKLPVGNNNGPFTMLTYSEEAEENVYFLEYKNEGTSHVPTFEVKYYMDEGAEGAISFSDGKISHIIYSLNEGAIAPGSIIDFRIKVKVDSSNREGEFELLNSGDISDSPHIEVAKKINISQLKLGAKSYIDGIENEVTINSTTTSSTLSIYPFIDGTLTDSQYIDMQVKIHLPYTLFFKSSSKNLSSSIENIFDFALTYKSEIKNIKPSDYIEPLFLDFVYTITKNSLITIDVDIEAKVYEQGETTALKTYQTKKQLKINYINTLDYNVKVISTSGGLNKNGSITMVYGAATSNETGKTGELILLLPKNNLESKYNGDYNLVEAGEYNILDNDKSFCTEDNIFVSNGLVSSVGKENEDEIWLPCSNYKDNNYKNITAIKRIVDFKEDSSFVFDFSTTDNEGGDKYLFKHYLRVDGEIKTSGNIEISTKSRQIKGFAWEDFDANGIYESNENKLPNIVFALYDEETDELISTTESDEKGNYSFSNIENGKKYYIAAIYDSSRYSYVAPRSDINDKSIISSFKTIPSDEINLLLGSNSKINQLVQNDSEINEEFGEDETFDEEEDLDGDEGIDGDNDLEEDEELDSDEYFDEDDNFDEDDDFDEDLDGDEEHEYGILITDSIEVSDDVTILSNINLGLTPKKIYTVKLNKYITKVITTNQLGISSTKDFGNVTFAKLDVKDINNLTIKVIYTLELENTGSYPGYVLSVKDFVPNGMIFNNSYEENDGWELTDNDYVENTSLKDEIIYAGEKKYLTIAFDITRKEAGSFVNYAVIDDDDLQILSIKASAGKEGEENE